jgi:bis(5'-adenosyl)-triphosphatase
MHRISLVRRFVTQRVVHVSIFPTRPFVTHRPCSSFLMAAAAETTKPSNVGVTAPLLPGAPHSKHAPLQVCPTLMKSPHPHMYPFGRIALPASSIFFATPLSFVSVNLSPIMPGHVLVMPRSNIARVTDLPPDQLCDLWLTAQHVGRVFEKEFKAPALTLAIQDGAEAGQKVPCVHIHLIPRQPKDLVNKDDIYGMIEQNIPAADVPPPSSAGVAAAAEGGSAASVPLPAATVAVANAPSPPHRQSSSSSSSAQGTLRDSLDDGKRIKRSLAEQAEEARHFARWMINAGMPEYLTKQGAELQLP